MRASCGTASSGSPTAVAESRPVRGRSRRAPRPAIARRTAGPISMCQVRGGIQDTWPDWARLKRISGATPAVAAVDDTAQAIHVPRAARAHARVARCAGRTSKESQFSRPHTRTAQP